MYKLVHSSKPTNNQKGQVILVLLLIMTVTLAFGLSVVQRSLSDVSTSSSVEQSSRAFSAAEAGLERAINTNAINDSSDTLSIPETDLKNSASANVTGTQIPDASIHAFEMPPFSKEEVSQVYLAGYTGSTLEIFWGKESATDYPALEVTIIYDSGGGVYKSQKYFFDPSSSRALTNGFTSVACGATRQVTTHLTPAPGKRYYCTQTLSMSSNPNPIMLRARLLYSGDNEHPLAVDPGSNNLPQQAILLTSEGTSGQTKRTIRLFKQDEVLPFFFDYVLFSVKSIDKS